MRVDITIDNGDAHVSIVQIFTNHTKDIEEGTYRFALPGAATVSDFAVWDGPVRIPAVILERKRAEQVYDQARLQAIDPGLLEADERDNKDPRTTSLFTAKIVPIPAYGTKRLEIEYHQRLSTSDFKQYFAFSLKPDAGQQQSAGSFTLHFVLHSAHTVEGTLHADHLSLDDDFTATWRLSQADADKLAIITHRDPHTPLPTAGEPVAAQRSSAPEPGFFEAQILLADPGSKSQPNPAVPVPSRTVILLFDNSLSMQWEKLEDFVRTETHKAHLRSGNEAPGECRPPAVPAEPCET
jgi:Ca-activated chloride channel homolog